MKRLADEIIQFFQNQSFVIVSTVDQDGTPHSACKGIIKITEDGKIYLLDVYLKKTFDNLTRNPKISVTAVDEHRFKGYCLKGKAELLGKNRLTPQIIKAWEDRITGRITRRLLKNIHEEKGHPAHPEALLPKPEYMIVMEIEEVIDLTPPHIKGER